MSERLCAILLNHKWSTDIFHYKCWGGHLYLQPHLLVAAPQINNSSCNTDGDDITYLAIHWQGRLSLLLHHREESSVTTQRGHCHPLLHPTDGSCSTFCTTKRTLILLYQKRGHLHFSLHHRGACILCATPETASFITCHTTQRSCSHPEN